MMLKLIFQLILPVCISRKYLHGSLMLLRMLSADWFTGVCCRPAMFAAGCYVITRC